MAGIENPEFDRALGAFFGGAIGDALGMPTQILSRAEITERYGQVSDFTAPYPGHPVSDKLPGGSVTDDTEQTLLLAQHIVASPEQFDEQGWAQALIDWEKSVKSRGLYDLLGPSTKRALDAVLKGVSPEKTGLNGDTNGAAMRIVPVGIVTLVEPLDAFVDTVAGTCRITHNTGVAIASASAVAAAVSAGIDGANCIEATEVALAAARQAENRARSRNDVSEQIVAAYEIADLCEGDSARLLHDLEENIGTSVSCVESVPAAMAIFKFAKGDAWQAGLLGANIGGDTDTIAAIAGGLCGATTGMSSLPADKVAILKSVNGLEIDNLVLQLLELRAPVRRPYQSMGQAI